MCIASNQIKSNQILFKVGNVHLNEKKISKNLFSSLYTITNNSKLYIYINLSILVHHCEIEHDHQMKIYLVSFRSTAFYCNLVYLLQRHFGSCHFLIWF